MDSSKGILKVHDACKVVLNVITSYLSDVIFIIKPMADGGEGAAGGLAAGAVAFMDTTIVSDKVVSGILKMARQTNTCVAVIEGQVNIPEAEYMKIGISPAIPAKPDDMPLDEALRESRSLLGSATKRFDRQYLAG